MGGCRSPPPTPRHPQCRLAFLTSPWLGVTFRTLPLSNSSSLIELWKAHSSTRTAVP